MADLTILKSRPISTQKQEKFPRTENIIVKVENFQLQNFIPTENLCRPITFYKIFFPRKIFLSGNGSLYFRGTGLQISVGHRTMSD
jgi:hypothetical protein